MSRKFVVRRIVDVVMTAAIVMLMSYQSTGQEVHEWTGITMFALFILHTILNRFWYKNLLNGRYSGVRILQTILDFALLAAFVLTAVSGILMSRYAVPFLQSAKLLDITQPLHLGISHWTFILISAHLGLHWGMMIRPLQKKKVLMRVLSIVAILVCGYGLALTVRNGIYSYLGFQVMFANFDYNKTAVQVFIENILMMASWAMIACGFSHFLQRSEPNRPQHKMTSIGMIAAEILVAVLFAVFLG